MLTLPAEYQDYLNTYGQFEGFTVGDSDPEYVELWALDELIAINQDIQTEVYAPGYVAFAGNGGGEILAFNSTGAVFTLPLIGMSPGCAIKIADTFGELAARFTSMNTERS